MAEGLQHLRGLLIEPAAINPTLSARLHAQKNVLCHGKMRTQAKFLMDVRDAAPPRLQRIGGMIGLSVKRDRSGIGTDGGRKNVHQRTFSGAVFADDGMHLLPAHRQIHAVQSRGGSEAFAHAGNLEHDGFGHCRYLARGGCNSCWASALSMLSAVTSITPVSM